MVDSIRMIVIIFLPRFTSIILIGLLGIDDADPRERRRVSQIFFILEILAIHVLYSLHPSFVKNISSELDKAGAKSICNSFCEPYPDLGVALHGIFPPVRLF